MANPDWLGLLRADPRPWLLEHDDQAVRHLTLRDLYRLPADDPELLEANRAAMRTGPIPKILAMQEPEGFWVKPGAGYSPKYRATTWQIIFLDQLGADGSDPGIDKAVQYLFAHAHTTSGGFGMSGAKTSKPPGPSTVLHCLNGNLVRALIGLGRLGDPRLESAIDWQARAITGSTKFYGSGTSGPGFQCAANDHEPCAWGAVKAVGALARIPERQRGAAVKAALKAGTEFLLSRDPAVADYPMGWGNTKPSRLWFKLGFPSGYVADVLQTLEVLVELGYGKDRRLRNAIEWILSKQDARGRWRNEYAYQGKMWCDIDRQGQPSKWVTLRVCRMLAAIK